jgi:hypothetical protein
MKNLIKIVVILPNGDEYFYKLPSGFDFDNEENVVNFVNQTANLFAISPSVQFEAEPDKPNGLQKKRTIMLWGEVLKKTYIKVIHY